jgi:uncharacterized protein DUF2637
MTPPNETATAKATPDRDWWVMAGMAVAAASAALASFSGLRGIAMIAGWPDRLAWLLPLTIDAHAMTSARVWLAASTLAPAAKRFARANALGAIAASIAGNAAYHAIGAGLLRASWPIVVTVGAVPAAVLGLTAHLHALRSRIEPDSPPVGRTPPGTQDRTRPNPRRGPGSDSVRPPARRGSKRPRPRTEDELMTAARIADNRYQDAHGRPITRDALRKALRISGARATELRRTLADEATKPPTHDQEPRRHTDPGQTPQLDAERRRTA